MFGDNLPPPLFSTMGAPGVYDEDSMSECHKGCRCQNR